MKPEGIRKVIAEQSLEGAIIYLSEQMESQATDAGHELRTALYQLQGKVESQATDAGHELRTALYQLQGKVEVLEDRVAKLEPPKTENPAVSSENGEQ